MKDTKFRTKLALANIERQVEDAYNEIFETMFPGIKISYPYKCDGYFESGNIKALVEYKYDSDYSDRNEMIKTVLQQLFYLKKFDAAGKPFPNVLVVADRNECFVFHPNVLLKYLDFPGVDWNVAPSSAGWSCPDLLLALNNDKDFNPFVFRIDEWFDTDNLRDKIVDLSKNVNRLVHISEHNIDKIFKTFTDQVFLDRKNISAHDLVGIFLGCICNKEECYPHPSKKNTLVTPTGNYRISGLKFEAFFKQFSDEISPREKLRLIEICDRLIEDTQRRRTGDFFTPTPFVDYAHKMITEWLGENWKDEYVVWDCCCGTKNLTRDYRFKELYCSTLEQSELEISKQYNPEAVSFQFDFLNDQIEKVPEGLKNALKRGRKILFFINPPYGKATGAGGKISSGASNTLMKSLMSKEGIEGSEILKQFLWRITDLKRTYGANIRIALYSTPTWMLKPQSKKFRDLFFDNFSFKDGIMFCASEFGDVSSAWGITFNLWNPGKQENRNTFGHTLLENKDDGIVEIGKKVLYNFDGLNTKTTTEYITERLGKKSQKDVILCINKKTMEFSKIDTRLCDDFICVCRNNANDIQQNDVCFIDNSSSVNGPGYLQLTKGNFDRCCITHSIRDILENNWIQHNDMYDMSHEPTPEFVNDSIVYAMFSNSCCSIRLDRDILPNEFFWMSKNEIMDLADKNNLDETYSDARTSDERFVFKKLQTITLSPEAQAVLDKANELVRKSFKYRSLFNDSHPEYQILNWDCGWYQIKALLKEFLPEDLKEFKALYNKLADKMRPQVYSLGFLKK